MFNKKEGKARTEANFGAWLKFQPTENRGYSWFPFDSTNWLTSDDVCKMTMAEQGMYMRALATQWRDGSLKVDPSEFAKQLACNVRTAQAFLSKWGTIVFTCLDHPNGEAGCGIAKAWSSKVTANLQQSCSKVAAELLQTCSSSTADLPQTYSKVTANLQQSCSKVANGQLHFLALDSGKVTLPGCLKDNREQKKREDNKTITSVVNDSNPASNSSPEVIDDELA